MSQKVVIQGELVSIINEEIVRQLPLADFSANLVQKVPVTIPLLPRTAVFAHWDETNPNEKRLYILAELPPGIRTIIKQRGTENRKYKLAFPWTYFWFVAVQSGARWSITTYKCFHAREQFSSLEQPLTVAFCHNVYRDTGDICFGSAGAPANQSIANQVDWLVNNWYQTRFNADLEGQMRYPFGGTSYKAWVDQTASDGNCWRDFPEWTNGVRHQLTVTQLIGAGVARATRIIADYAIPEIPAPMTFGRAEEWLRSLTAENRGRLRVALNNIGADNPDAIVDPIREENVPVEDDGGLPA